MKLIHHRDLTAWERPNVYKHDEAVNLIKHALDHDRAIKGLEQLRLSLTIDLERKILEHVKSGEWLLIHSNAYAFYWGAFEKAAAESRARYARVIPIDYINDVDLYPPNAPEHTHDRYLIFKNQDDKPQQNVPYIIKNSEGQVIEGRSDFAGRTKKISGKEGTYIHCQIACYGGQ